MGLYKFFSWKKFILGIILTQYAKRVFYLPTHTIATQMMKVRI